MDKGLETRYFLGANTGAGYCSFFSHFLRQPGRCVHILKGGPGCGKSTFLRRVGERAQQLGLHTVYLHCSGDPGSLDGVFFPETNTGYLDGTAPHVCDPVLFGITGDYLDLGAFCRTKLLDTERIRQLSMDCPLFYRRAYEYLAAAAALDARKQPGLLFPEDRAAARRRAAGTALREFGAVKKDAVPGRFEKRFLRAITCEGRAAFPQTVEALAERVYLLDNDCGLAEDYLRVIREHALRRGLTLIVCPDPLLPERTEAVLVPDLHLAFLTADAELPCPHAAVRHIRLDAIPDSARLRALRTRMRADKRLQQQAIDAAIRQLQAAKLLHDELEAVYQPCMDFDALTAFTDQHLQTLLA